MKQRLHPALGWALSASLLASGWAVWWPDEPLLELAIADAARSPARAATTEAMAARQPEAGSAITQRFATKAGDAPMLSPASRDPFNPAPPPAPPAPAKTVPEPVRSEPTTPPPPAPTAPPMNHRVVGRFQTPEGQWLVFLQDGNRTVPAASGVALASGYVVESVTPSEIRLRHPLAQQPVSLPLPTDNAP